MPVAYDQIQELLDVLRGYVAEEGDIRLLLTDLLRTTAAKRNPSFRVTIQRVLDRAQWKR